MRKIPKVQAMTGEAVIYGLANGNFHLVAPSLPSLLSR